MTVIDKLRSYGLSPGALDAPSEGARMARVKRATTRGVAFVHALVDKDRARIRDRFGVSNPDGDFVVEQQAYLSERDGRIGWMRVLCSGFRPPESPDEAPRMCAPSPGRARGHSVPAAFHQRGGGTRLGRASV